MDHSRANRALAFAIIYDLIDCNWSAYGTRLIQILKRETIENDWRRASSTRHEWMEIIFRFNGFTARRTSRLIMNDLGCSMDIMGHGHGQMVECYWRLQIADWSTSSNVFFESLRIANGSQPDHIKIVATSAAIKKMHAHQIESQRFAQFFSPFLSSYQRLMGLRMGIESTQLYSVHK